ncbi:hypothetical protein PFISCL1PPCAC_23972, partial [Pristionchus fissidentatus]
YYGSLCVTIFRPIRIILHLRIAQVLISSQSKGKIGKALRFCLLHISIHTIIMSVVQQAHAWCCRGSENDGTLMMYYQQATRFWINFI